MQQHSVRPRASRFACRGGLPDGSAWHDFLAESGDLDPYAGDAISEEERLEDATRALVLPPSGPASLAAELLT